MAGRWVDAPLPRNSGPSDSAREVAGRLRGPRDVYFFGDMMTLRVLSALVTAMSLAQFDCHPAYRLPAGVYQVTAVRFATEPSYPTRFLVAGADSTRRLASNPRLIVPGHDVAVFERFPTPGHGVAHIE